MKVEHRSLILTICLLAISFVTPSTNAYSQAGTTSPDRGAKLGNSYSIGEFDTINTTNGNLMFNIPLASLPKGRAMVNAGITLTYNSKLYDLRTYKIRDWRYPTCTWVEESSEPADCRYFYKTMLEQSNKGGWRMGFGQYELEFENRAANLLGEQPSCMGGIPLVRNSFWGEQTYIHKLRIMFPDGSSHEMLPLGYTDYVDLHDKYYNVTHDGYIEDCGASRGRTGHPMTYYSDDGSFLRLTFSYDNDADPNSNTWTLYFPDGSKVTSGGYSSGVSQRIYDRNGNYIEGLTDEFGRSVSIQYNPNGDQEIRSKGVNGSDIVWTIKWKNIFVKKTFQSCNDGDGSCPTEDQRSNLDAVWPVVDKIIEPSQLGGRSYTFSYNAHPYPNPPSGLSNGWGEVSAVELPSGAVINYAYAWDGQDGPTDISQTKDLLKNYPTAKSITHDGVTETWGYNTSNYGGTVVDPSGVTTTNFFTDTTENSWLAGLTYKTVSSNGTMTEKIWSRNIPGGQSGALYYAGNPYVKTEFTSIKDAAGNYSQTAIKDLTYDKNGNVTETREYDFVPYSSVPRNQYGENPTIPTGISPSRITKTEFYNPVPAASSTDYSDADAYIYGSSKRLLGLVKNTEIQDVSGTPKSRSEMVYDFTNYDGGNTKGGNVTETKTWDSFKGGTARAYSNPLTSTNSISTSATYNPYGMPLTTTDGNNVTTQITYGDVIGPNGAVTDLYPTQVVTAYGTSVARTSAAVYDFYTGLVTTATDVDNNVSVVNEYDALGRPTKVRSAAGTSLESWTRTEYDDVNRRVIVRADLAAVGDGKKVAIQHYDQLGRVRLSRSLENAATEDPYNETHGIKVETRYKTVSGYTYQLTSNPYRANYSSNETDPTMGWTLSTAWSDGKRSEVQTFAGAGLPTVFGGNNTNSTGIVRTDIDANATTVTDQAGKLRRSITNGLGQLIRVDEPNSSNQLGTVASPNQKTDYTYDVLNNLLTVTQAGSGTTQCGPSGGTCTQTRTFTYGSLSRLLSANNPESGTIYYSYDPNGNLTTKTDARSITTTYTYDPLNRVTNRAYTNEPSGSETPDVDYFYGTTAPKVGKLVKVTNGTGADRSTTEYTSFDILGRVTGHKQTTDGNEYTTGYTYYLSGGVNEQTYPSGRVVKNTLDADGSLGLVQSKKTSSDFYRPYASNFLYNAAGAVTAMRLGNGRWENMEFNSRLQPTKIGLGSGVASQSLLKLEYSYGTTQNNGNVVEQKITVPGVAHPYIQAYTYDELNRLSVAEETQNSSQTWKQTFVYDRYGNRNFNTSGSNTTTLPSGFDPDIYNPTISTTNNRSSSGQGYSYDASGNTTLDAENRKFTYDAENKQVKVETVDGSGNPTATIGEYFYDGDGKRTKKYVPGTGETTIFVYDASGKQIAEYSTIVQTESNAKITYTTNDHLGSPRINTDVTGQVISRHDYHPFGEEIARTAYGSDTIRKKFTGYERDNEINLDFAEARYYNPANGRFTSPDDFFNDTHIPEPQSWNLYAYVRNSPLSAIDPTGMMTDFIDVGTGNRVHVDDGKDQVIAAQSADIAQFQKEINSDRAAYDQRLRVFENSANNLNMTTAQFNDLAGVIYAEASNNAPWQEAAGIHAVLRNRAAADGNTVLDQANDTSQVFGANDKNKAFSPNASQAKLNAVYKGIALSVVAFKANGSDLSNGAYYWHGTDFRRPTAGSKAHERFYRTGFQFTSPSHDIWKLGDRKSGNKKFDFKYESTAAYGQTTFMKLTQAWMKANGATRWNGKSK